MRFILPAIALAALAAGPAAAQDKVPTAAHVLESLDACMTVVDAEWIELNELRSLGYDNARAKARNNRTRSVRGLYQKAGNPAIIIMSKAELDEKHCVVSAALAQTADYVPLAQQVSQTLGMPVSQAGAAYFWAKDDRRIKIEPEGDAEKPFARFTVSVADAD